MHVLESNFPVLAFHIECALQLFDVIISSIKLQLTIKKSHQI